MIRTRSRLVLLALAGVFAFIVGASPSLFARGQAKPVASLQDPPPPAQDPETTPGRGGRGGQPAAPRPYAQVITSAAKTDEGIFKVHRVADTLYYEIPKAELGKDFLWNTQIKKTTIGAGLGGQIVSSRVVRWVQKGDRVLLESIDYSVVSADPTDPVAMAVDNSNYPSIIRTMPVAAYAPSGDPVIDVTALFMTDIPEFSARAAVGGRGLAADRSFLDRAVSFPSNINVEATLTYTGGAADPAAGGGGRGGRGAGIRGPSGTVVVHHSLVKLPERPLMPRHYDDRVGFFTQQLVDFGTDEHRSVQKQFIKRFRLEKKDANAAVSDPVQPIVFYIDPATPKQWVASVRKGIESWQPALEMAGFRNAIVARDAPAGDAEWSAEDARYSVVRWLPAPDEAAGEPPAHDPRSGEILKAEIPAYPDMANFGTNWYVVQAGPADKRVQKLPLPDEIMSELIRFTVAHQIGHALGLQHNMKASSSYTIAQIRDPKWVKDMGFTPSIMDNTRFNYVAQPEDGIDPVDLIPKIGPYDKWAIRWGYAPVPGAATSDAEESTLDKWAREQDDKPYLRFSTEGPAGIDPGDGPEAVGNADAVMATTLGVKNLVRVSDMLLAFTGTKTGDPWDDLETLYGRMASQWSTEMSQVVRVVGGIESQQTHIGQAALRFRTVPRLRQQQALQFLLGNAFTTPTFMIKPEILRRIQPSGVVQRVRTAQTSLLASLLENSRLDRMAEQFTIDGPVAYPPLQFLADLRAGIWSELKTPGTSVDIYRRNVQRAYLDQMDARLYGAPASSDETRALVKGELRALDRQLQTAAAAPGLDETTRRHYLNAREAIATTLDPRVPRPAPAAGAAGAGRGGRGGVASLAPGRVQDPPPTPPQDPPDPAAGRGGRGGQGGQGGAPRPYAQVITAAAKTEQGVFKVHRIGETLYYEIPKSELGKDFLWNTQLKKTTIGAGYGGQTVGSRVVRWIARGDRVLLVNVDYTLVTDAKSALTDTANYPAIIRTFNVAAYAANGDPVIDVTQLFTTDVPEFSARASVGGRGMDASRTFLERAVAFPQNINVEVTATYTSAAADPTAPAPAGGGRGGGARALSPTVLVHHTMLKLPETPMMPRLFDERVGYFTQGLTDYGTGERQAAPTRYITRYRLEKKDPSAAISEPVKPITYYVDPATPKKWVPCIKRAIESWQPAFEMAGFKNGIVAKEAPSKAEDPNWSIEDIRYSVIDYLPSTTENAVGPNLHDPRSGEIINANVQYYHNVMNLAKNWYFVQAGPNDPRAQTLPLPDDLMCNLVQYVVAHEVGHTLGFQHNMKASSTYTIEQIRDPKWVKENGHTPTLMDYSRFNYVAQPEDKIDPADLIPKIGPYDKWATMWGYKPIPGVKTPEEEKKTLDSWAREQDAKPYLRFSTEGNGGTDPGDETEAVGDGDAVRATMLGLKNLGRISEMILKATSTKVGDPWSELAEVYARMVGQWTTELGHVTRVIGGVDSQQKHIGQTGVRFTTVAKTRQVDALQFLLNNAFQTPSFMIRPEILRRIQPTGVIARVRTAQAGILSQLLQSAKLDRMAEQAALDGPLAYSPLQFLGDLRTGIWGEVKPGAAINIYRRNLHRSYLNNMDTLVNGASSDEVRALARGELRALDRQLQMVLPGVTDELTRRHVIDCRDEIQTILDPLVPRPAPAAGNPFGGRGGIRR